MCVQHTLYNILLYRIANLHVYTRGNNFTRFCLLKILKAGYSLYTEYQYSYCISKSDKISS